MMMGLEKQVPKPNGQKHLKQLSIYLVISKIWYQTLNYCNYSLRNVITMMKVKMISDTLENGLKKGNAGLREGRAPKDGKKN